MILLKSLGFAVLGAAAGFGLGYLFLDQFPGPRCCELDFLEPIVIGFFAGLVGGAVAPLVAAAMGSRLGDDRTVAPVALLLPPAAIAVGSVLSAATRSEADLIVPGVVGGAVFGVSVGLALARWRTSRPNPAWLPVFLIAGIAGATAVGKVARAVGPGTSEELFHYLWFIPADGLEVLAFLYLAVVVPLVAWGTLTARAATADRVPV